jgi:hypothetical protein
VTTSSSPESQGTPPSIISNHSPNSPSNNKEAWPSLQPGAKPNNKPVNQRTDQHNRLNNKNRTEDETDHKYVYISINSLFGILINMYL